MASMPPWRPRLDRLLHDPRVELGLVVLILGSIAGLIYEWSLPSGDPRRLQAEAASDLITGVFAVELGLRLLATPRRRRFLSRYWPDLLAILPVLRPLRFLRVLMLLRLFRAGALSHRRASAFRGGLRATLQELTLLATASVALILAGGLALRSAEQGSFASIVDALWYAAYVHVAGESIGAAPQTTVGRFATLGLMFGGMTIFGVFIGTVSAWMTPRLARVDEGLMELEDLERHTIVFGWNRAGPSVLAELFAEDRREPVVLVTELATWPDDVPWGPVPRELLLHVVGDWTRVDLLHRVRIEHAATSILLADTQTPRSDQDRDARTVLAALTIEKLAPKMFTVAELTNRENERVLRMARVEEIIVADEYSATILGAAARNRGLVSLFDEVLTRRWGNAFRKLPAGRFAGRRVGDLLAELKRDHDAILVALISDEGGDLRTRVNPASDRVVAPDDQLVVLSERDLPA